MLSRKTENSYKELLDSMKAVPVPCEETIEVVEWFKRNHPMLFSARCRSRITNLERLLHELDKGLFIHPLNVEYLLEIVDKLENTRIKSLYRTHANNVQQYLLQEQQSRQNGTLASHSRVPSAIPSGLTPEGNTQQHINFFLCKTLLYQGFMIFTVASKFYYCS
jgi:hypothetical protein